MRKTEFQFLRGVLGAFYELRRHSVTIWDVYFTRLLKEANVRTTVTSQAEGEKRSGFVSRLRSMARGALYFINCVPFYLEQMRRLRAHERAQLVKTGVVLAVSSRRLYAGIASAENPRRYLAFLASHSFKEEPYPHGLDRLIESTPTLFTFEPERKSPLWSVREKCWNNGVFIVDGNFLIFTAALAILRFRVGMLGTALANWKSCAQVEGAKYVKTRAFAQVLIASLCADACENLLRDFESVDSIFYTSNSFLTEVLRFHLLKSSNCKSVCEVMHGVPTWVYERYLKAMLEAGRSFGSYEKHSSIGQIPGLKTFGVLDRDVKLDTGIAINTYLNRYILECGQKYSSPETYVHSELAKVLGGRMVGKDTRLVSFVGGISHEGDFFESEVFKLEVCLIETALEALKATGHPFLFLYSPHPGHDFDRIKNHPFYKKNDIVLVTNTVFTWFISDLSIGLFSGALFECAYFGVKTFGPMKLSDDLYPDVILETIDYQRDGVSAGLTTDLTAFVRDRSREWQRERPDLASRARERLNLLSPKIWAPSAEITSNRPVSVAGGQHP